MWLSKIFKKKEYNWIDIKFKVTYDLSKSIPDLSKNSPIKTMDMSYYFKYCTINNELLKFTIPNRGFIKVDLKKNLKKYPELKEKIDQLTKDKRRDKLIDNILKKINESKNILVNLRNIKIDRLLDK